MKAETFKILKAMRDQAKISASGNTDAQAYGVIALHDYWPDIPNGSTLEEKKIVLHSDGILYRVKDGMGHQKQVTTAPDVAASLFTPIPRPGEDGTKDNPIAWVEGMESEVGKYYTDEGVLYIGLENSGTGLYGRPKDLARYFQTVEE